MFSSTTNIRKAVGEYILDEPLFMDAFSSTYLAFHVNTCQEALVRIIETSTLSMIENSYQLMQDEVQLLRQLNHPNIIKLINTFSTKNNCYIIYEHCSGGSLETYVNLSRFLPESEVVKFIHEILGGYGELYRRNITLKSIRLDSFVMHENSVKLFDISIVKNFEKFKQGTFLKTNVKFWYSLAPEIYFGASQTNRCDIWSLGIIFYQMLYGELPWRSDNVQEFFKAATTQAPNFANKYQQISRHTIGTLTKMLQPDPTRRITYEDLCKEPLFVNYYDMLQKQEQKIVEKIKRNPECWQAASMMYTGDPLISIFDLSDSIKSSTSKKSTPSKTNADELKALLNQSNGLDKQVLNQGNNNAHPGGMEPIWRIDQVEEMRKVGKTVNQGGQNYMGVSMRPPTTQQQQNNFVNPRIENKSQFTVTQPGTVNTFQRQESGLSAFEKLEAEIKSLGVPTTFNMNNPSNNFQAPQNFGNQNMIQMNQSMPVIGRNTNNSILVDNNKPTVISKTNESISKNKQSIKIGNIEEEEGPIDEGTISMLRQAVSTFNNQKMPGPSSSQKINQSAQVQQINPQNMQNKKTREEAQANSQTFPPEMLGEFRRYTGRISFLCEFFQLYSQAASSAAKLFKTEMIIFQCFFLYKKLLKSIRVLYEAMAKEENIFRFKHWEEYCNSSHYFNAVEIIENHMDKVEDIFDKIYIDCLKKLNEKRSELAMMKEYITEDLEGIDTQLNSFLVPYLEKFLVSEELMSDPARAFLIFKHRLEIVNVLLLNKMPESNIEEVIVSLKDHKKAMKNEDVNSVKDYFNQQYKKYDLFKLNTFKNIV